jgi:hypothetical protein
MSIRTILFLVALFFIIGMVIGFSARKPYTINKPIVTTITVRDTILKLQSDTIKIPINQVKYFTKTDTVIVKSNPDSVVHDSLNCVTFPLLLSDSSTIAVTECSKDAIPKDLTFDAKYIDKRERIRIVEKTRVDTVHQKYKRLGFALGPSAGIGIDINNPGRPAYFIGATLTYGFRIF